MLNSVVADLTILRRVGRIFRRWSIRIRRLGRANRRHRLLTTGRGRLRRSRRGRSWFGGRWRRLPGWCLGNSSRLLSSRISRWNWIRWSLWRLNRRLRLLRNWLLLRPRWLRRVLLWCRRLLNRLFNWRPLLRLAINAWSVCSRSVCRRTVCDRFHRGSRSGSGLADRCHRSARCRWPHYRSALRWARS